MSTIISLTFSFLFFFFFFSSSINAFNITEMLNDHADFSSFNEQLTKTRLASTINARRTITVLAVDNGAVSSISGMPEDEVKKVLSLHVVLDYYDMQKLDKMVGKSRVLTTLFQASGQANGQQGFLNATKTENGVVFGSAVEGSSPNSRLMRSVASQPYNISILQVSSVIVPPNLSNSTASPPPTTTVMAPTPAATSPAPNHPTPPPHAAPAPSESNSPDSNAPSSGSAPPSPDGAPDSDGPLLDALPPSPTLSSGTTYYNSLCFGIGAVMVSLKMMGAL